MSQFYVSAEDDLMRIFGGERLKNIMSRLGVKEDMPIENKTLSKAIENAQKKVEDRNFDQRKNVVQYDDVMNRHRKAIYSKRQAILKNEHIDDDINNMIKEELTSLTTAYAEDKEGLKKELETLIPYSAKALKSIIASRPDNRVQRAIEEALKIRRQRVKEFGLDKVRALERQVYLQVMDVAWMQHLENMQYLKEGIGWRSIGQRDPLVEYRREGQAMFEKMVADMRANVIQIVFRSTPLVEQEEEAIETELTRAAKNAVEIDDSSSVSGKARRGKETKVGTSRQPVAKTKLTKAQRKRKRKSKRKRK